MGVKSEVFSFWAPRAPSHLLFAKAALREALILLSCWDPNFQLFASVALGVDLN